jgi:DNA-binding protein H-NS
MATYAEIQAQITQLQQQAEAIKKHELAAVIADVKAKIAHYGLTAHDLGLAGSTLRGARKSTTSATRFVGPQGQTWSGFGRQPQWLHDAIAAGKTKADFAA